MNLFTHQSNLIICNNPLTTSNLLLFKIEDYKKSSLNLDTEKDGINIHNYSVNFLTIEEVRNIKRSMLVKDSNKSLYIIAFNSIREESQNALLKLLEEPWENSYVYIIVQNENILLDTIKSRLFRCDIGEFVTKNNDGNIRAEEINDLLSKAREFLQTEPLSRMNLDCVKDVLDIKDSSDRVDKSEGVLLLDAIMKEVLKHKIDSSPNLNNKDENAKGLETKDKESKLSNSLPLSKIEKLIEILSHANVIGFSLKSAFEFYSLTIPKFKYKD